MKLRLKSKEILSSLLCFLNHSAVLVTFRLEVKTRASQKPVTLQKLKLGERGFHSLKWEEVKKEKGMNEEEYTLIFPCSSFFLSTCRYPLTHKNRYALYICYPTYNHRYLVIHMHRCALHINLSHTCTDMVYTYTLSHTCTDMFYI